MGDMKNDWTLGDAKLISPQDADRILARAKEAGELDPMFKRDYDWFFIAFNTGLRLSEVGHIEKGDVLPKRLIVTRRKKRHLQPAPIEVAPAVHEVLKARADQVEAGYIFPGRAQPCLIHRKSKKNGPSVEQVCIGGHASLRSIQRRWRLLIEELGIYQYGRGVHSARHTAITTIYRMTKDLRLAQVFAGHSSSAITERYAHVVDLDATLAKMPIISGNGS